MDAAEPSVIFGALLGDMVLVAALIFLGRLSGTPRSLVYFAAALAGDALYVLTMTLAGADSGKPLVQILLGGVDGGVGAALTGAALCHLAPRHWPRAAWTGARLVVVVCLVWAALGGWLLERVAMAAPLAVLGGVASWAAAFAFWRRSRAVPGCGHALVAALLALSGLHRFAFPWEGGADWALPAGFVATQVLGTALAVALLISAERERRAFDERGRRKALALLRLQAEAMAATANAIFITNRSGRIEWCNRAFSTLTGWSETEARGRGARRLLLGPERDRRMEEMLAATRPWRGECSLRRRDGTLYVVDQTITPIIGESGRVSHYVVVQEDVTERRRAEERIRFLSNHDSLTALPNRLLFRDRLQRSVARARIERGGLALLIVDLDDFSHYNDVLGHDGGDMLLLAVVERLMAEARGADCVGRVGGDEFGIVVEADDGGESAATLAQTVLAALNRPFDVNGHEIALGAVVGIALYPADGADADALIKNADMAMYRAIRENPNGYRFFAPTMDAELAERRRLESDLRKAISRDELSLHYQPIVAAIDHRIVGFEALLRWKHHADGMISPAQFIPMAEAIGLIAPIGEWVLRQACGQMRDWALAGLPMVPVAVNMSALQLRRQDVPMLVRKILTETGIASHRLELELTETTVMEDADAAQRILSEIAGQGVKLAVDDFGTGYSSLARLKRFPVGKLKIDRSFVGDVATDDSDAAIARAAISMGHAMGLQVVAEGVETLAQLDLLTQAGCDSIQGFLFSRAVPADQAAAMLAGGGVLSPRADYAMHEAVVEGPR